MSNQDTQAATRVQHAVTGLRGANRKHLWAILVAASAVMLAPSANAQTVQVSATTLWTDTGIALVAGQTVQVTASGTVTTGGMIPAWATDTPDGQPLSSQCEVGKTGTFPAPGLPCFSLMGEITQTGTPFEVGSSVTFAVETSGEFYLGINDNYLPDNAGDWTAVVTVYPSTQLVLGCQPSQALTTLTAGLSFSATCNAYGGTAPYTWTTPITNLPAGLTPTPNGSTLTITGTSTTGGPYSYTIGVGDSSSPVQNQALTYQGTIGTLIISCDNAAGPAQVGGPYTATCTASGGAQPYTWSFGGTPPAGTALSDTTGSSVMVTDTPTATGGYSYTVQVTDSSSPAQTNSVSYNGLVGDMSLSCTPTTGPTQAGVPYSATCTAANGTSPYNWSIVNGTLPTGLVLTPNGTSATIAGIPAAGAYNYTVQLSDSNNPTETQILPFSGTAQGPALSVSPTSLSFSYEIGTAQPASQMLAISSSPVPVTFTAAASTNDGNNWLSVTPTTTGTTPASLTVSVNAAGLAAGPYTGTVTVTAAAGTTNSPYQVTVTLTVIPGATTTTVAVPANTLWTQTGIILTAGETVSVTATGTVATGGMIPGWGQNSPDGQPLPQCAVGRTSPFPAPQLRCYSLMGEITSSGIPFEVGSSVIFPVLTSGELYLGMNDNVLGDNSGSWTAMVTVYPPQQLVLGCQPSQALTTLTTSLSFTGTCNAYGGTQPYTWSPVTLPSGLTATPNGSTETITGAPTAGGPYSYMIGVSDASSPAQSQMLTYQGTIGTLLISCNTTTGTPIPDYPNIGPAQVGDPYSATCTASGGTQPYTWSFGGTPPGGTALSGTTGSSVTVTDTPAATGGYSYTVQVTDTSTPPQTNSVSYDGIVGNLSITCNPTTGPTQVNVNYQSICTASAGTTPYNWTVNGSLPLGLSLSISEDTTTATISGNPSVTGLYTYTLQLTDSNNPTEIQTQPFTGNIQPQQVTLSASPLSLSFSYQINGPATPSQTLTVSSSPAVATSFTAATSGGSWLSVTPTSGSTSATLMVSVITTGLSAGTYSGMVTITASGASNSPYPVQVNLTVTNPGAQVSTVPVPATQLWTDTGIMVTAGETVYITASGAVQTGGQIPAWASNTPDGQPLSSQCATGRSTPFPFPSLACFSLIGAITQSGPPPTTGGSPFEVGSSATFPVAASGELYLGINDNVLTGNNGSWTAQITVYPQQQLVLGCQPPPSLTTLTAGVSYTAPCNAYGGTPPYAWASVTLPGGLTAAVNGSTETITGAPTTGGPYNFSIGVSDSSTTVQTQMLTYQGTIGTLTISCNPTTGPAQVNGPYSSTCTAAGGTAPYTWSFGGTPPAGTALSGTTGSSVTVTDTPTATGGYSYTAQVTDSSAPAQTNSVSFNGIVGDLALTCSPTTGPVQSGLYYSATCTASGGMLPYNWTIVSGTLPSGLTQNVDGATFTISGTPTAGTYMYTVQLTDSNDPTETQTYPYTLAVQSPVTLTSSPQSLPNFTYQMGSAAPSPQTLTISSSSMAGLPFTAAPSTNNGGNWLSVSPTSGTAQTSLTVSVASGLAAGTYSGAVTISSSGASNSPLIVPVNLTVTPAATITVSPTTLTFAYQIGGSAAPMQTVSVASNPSSTILNFSVASGSGCSWLTLTPSGTVTPATITALVNTASLTATTYNCSFTVAGGSGSPVPVNATLAVTPAVFSVNPLSLSFNYQATSTMAVGLSQTISLTTSQPFTATASTNTTAGQWLAVSPASGTGTTTLAVSLSPTVLASLAVGTYNGMINIASGGSTQSVFVALTVTGPTLTTCDVTIQTASNPCPTLPSFTFVAPNSTSAAQTLAVTASNSQAVSFTASSACPWLSSLPAGTLQTGTSTVTLTPNTTVLTAPGSYPPGTYNCTLTINSPQASNSPLSVPLTLLVSPDTLTAMPGTVAFNAQQGSSTPLLSTVAVNAQAPVSFTAGVSGCPSASWLSVNPTAGTTPANLNLQANPTGLNASPPSCQITVSSSQGQSQTINVSLSISTLPTLIIAPNQLSFTYTQNATAQPLTQVFSVLASGNAPITFQDSVTTGNGGSWLHVSTSPGTQNVTVSVDSTLVAGFYSGTITINSTATNPNKQTLPVSVLVNPPPPAAPILTAVPRSLTFSFSASASGGGASQLLSVVNQGGGAPTISASASTDNGGPWLTVPSVTAAGSTVTSPASVTVNANPAAVIPGMSGQIAGTYSGTVVLTSPNLSPIIVPVTMTVTALPIVQLSRTALSYTAVLGGNQVPSQDVDILNPGSGTLQWSAQAGQSGCGDWLTFPGGAQGTVTAGTPSKLYVALNDAAIQSQAANTYYCTLQVTAQDATSGQVAANSPQTVVVVLNLLPAGSYVSPFVQPGGYVFTGAAGSTVPPAQITIFSPALQSVSYSSAAVTNTGGTWCTVSPDHATVTNGAEVLITADYTNLTANTQYLCTVQLSFSDGSLQTITLPAIVSASGVTAANASTPRSSSGQVRPRTSGQSCSPEPPSFINPSAGFNAVAFQAMEVDIQIQDSCGNAIDTQNQFLISTYSGNNTDPAGDFIGPTQIGPGLYKYQWTPTSIPQNVSQSAVMLSAFYFPSATSLTPTTTVLPGMVSLTSNPARVSPGGISNAASYTGQMSVGAIIAIFGENLANGTAGAIQIPLPVELQGTSVYVDDQELPLFYTSSGQINAQIPYNLNTNSPHQLIVERDGARTIPQTFTLADEQPAIFTTNAGGYGQGVIFGPGPDGKYDTNTLADSNNPVSIGDYLVIYCSGLGAVTPGVTAGQIPLPYPTDTKVMGQLTVTIGNVPATNITYEGLNAQYVGLYQVNVQVPEGVQTGNEVPVVIAVGNLQSQPGVTVAVKGQ